MTGRDESRPADGTTGPRVVAFGGGHGLAASLAALRTVTDRLTAVVTVADDGGSSGVLREELGVLPPGDLRMALAALAADPLWAQVVQHRFGGSGSLAGHPVGNLMLCGLIDVLGDPVEALAAVANLLGVRGTVLPVSTEPLEIVADVIDPNAPDHSGLAEVRGQVAVATTPADVVGVRVEPPGAVACPQAVDAVLAADWVILGPGSWFTSVIPHLLLADMAKALSTTTARRLVVLNLAPQRGETDGFSPATHLEVLASHAPDFAIDVVLADQSAVPAGEASSLHDVAGALGAELVITHVASDGPAPLHDPARLAAAYSTILTSPAGS
ncbi:MAG TPA: uridine diphosphate-N-acetylglucosamine-binding protein YvcK [Mycobacteriales bacterium]|nr:uridine diphosphate-N-acetylglucosamine-binding protein YvcK [Mycobacteriales bacterium]